MRGGGFVARLLLLDADVLNFDIMFLRTSEKVGQLHRHNFFYKEI